MRWSLVLLIACLRLIKFELLQVFIGFVELTLRAHAAVSCLLIRESLLPCFENDITVLHDCADLPQTLSLLQETHAVSLTLTVPDSLRVCGLELLFVE